MEATRSSVIKQAIRPCCLNLTRSVLLFFFFFCHFFFYLPQIENRWCEIASTHPLLHFFNLHFISSPRKTKQKKIRYDGVVIQPAVSQF